MTQTEFSLILLFKEKPVLVFLIMPPVFFLGKLLLDFLAGFGFGMNVGIGRPIAAAVAGAQRNKEQQAKYTGNPWRGFHIQVKLIKFGGWYRNPEQDLFLMPLRKTGCHPVRNSRCINAPALFFS